MSSDEIRALIAAREEPTIQGRAAAAAYLDALDWQERGVPGPERVARLMLFVECWRAMEREALDAELDAL